MGTIATIRTAIEAIEDALDDLQGVDTGGDYGNAADSHLTDAVLSLENAITKLGRAKSRGERCPVCGGTLLDPVDWGDDMQHCPQPNCPIHTVDVKELDGDE